MENTKNDSNSGAGQNENKLSESTGQNQSSNSNGQQEIKPNPTVQAPVNITVTEGYKPPKEQLKKQVVIEDKNEKKDNK